MADLGRVIDKSFRLGAGVAGRMVSGSGGVNGTAGVTTNGTGAGGTAGTTGLGANGGPVSGGV